MALFTQWLSGREETDNRVVIDATGLEGGFDFTLHWTPDSAHMEQLNGAGGAQGAASAASQDSARLSILTALQEQLGLKLEPRRAPVAAVAVSDLFDAWAKERKFAAKTEYSWKKIVGKLTSAVIGVKSLIGS